RVDPLAPGGLGGQRGQRIQERQREPPQRRQVVQVPLPPLRQRLVLGVRRELRAQAPRQPLEALLPPVPTFDDRRLHEEVLPPPRRAQRSGHDGRVDGSGGRGIAFRLALFAGAGGQLRVGRDPAISRGRRRGGLALRGSVGHF